MLRPRPMLPRTHRACRRNSSDGPALGRRAPGKRLAIPPCHHGRQLTERGFSLSASRHSPAEVVRLMGRGWWRTANAFGGRTVQAGSVILP
jgi:hypothetical protein